MEYPTTAIIADMVTYSVKLKIVKIIVLPCSSPEFSYCARAIVGALMAIMTSAINP